MDLSSLNPRGFDQLDPRAYDNPMVETVVAFDDNGVPYYATVPVPPRMPVPAPQRYAPQPYAPNGQAPGQMAVYQPVQPYYGQPAPREPYSPIHDPIVCRLLAGTVAVVGGAFALSFVLAALAAAETALGFLLGILALIWLMSSGKGGSGKAVSVNITNSNKSRHRN